MKDVLLMIINKFKRKLISIENQTNQNK